MEKFLRKINVDVLFYIMLFLFFVFSLFFLTFRDAIRDETIYIHETYLISELFKNGIWIGDYAVGLHGFLFKIPPALVFLFTGPSVFILTFYNILLACLVCFFFYKLLKEAFGWRINALLALGLFMVNFHFLLSLPTYLREMPSLFVVMLLLYGIFKNYKPWVLGLIFLLLLDAKEYLFFMFGFGYFIWICVQYLKTRDFKRTFFELIQVFGFSLIYIILMFTTSLIPLNMFLASILSLISNGSTYLVAQFSVDTVGVNLLKGDDVKTIFQFTISEDSPSFIRMVLKILNTNLSYIGKLLYPRTFSFIAVPKVIMLPAVYMAWKMLKEKGQNFKKILSVLFFTYLAIYLLRTSHGRYLLPIVPVIAIFFVSFMHYPFKNKKDILLVLTATFFFMLFGFIFEASYLPFKILIEVFLFACIAVAILKPFNFSKYFYLLFQKATIVFCIIVMLGASVLFSLTQGQIKRYMLFGENREIEKTISIIPEGEKVWINNTESYDLMAALLGQTYSWPEWKWDLAPIIPKKTLLRAYGDQYLYNEFFVDLPTFKQYLKQNDINYFVFLESEIEDEPFEYQSFIQDFKNESWLVKEKVENLQNKKVYLFKVDL